MQTLLRVLFVVATACFGATRSSYADNELLVWANSGEDKVAREETRLIDNDPSTRNNFFDGTRITLSGAQNETVAFTLVVETDIVGLSNVRVSFDRLNGPNGSAIHSRPQDPETLFDYRNRPIELFYIRYLRIKGLSRLAYNHYDERHVPRRFQRPHDADGDATGAWTDRPDHDRSYPDIAVPIELIDDFDVSPKSSQSIWCDVYIPRNQPPGEYTGTIVIECDSRQTRRIPVSLTVLPFRLPDLPTAKTMLYVSRDDISARYVSTKDRDDETSSATRLQTVVDRHFQMAHRHRVSLISDHIDIEDVDHIWNDRLNGDLFTPNQAYEGPGEGVGNGVFSIGTYGSWPWRRQEKGQGKVAMQNAADRWATYFDQRQDNPPVEYFLYLIDESEDYGQIEQWASWIRNHDGPGNRVPTLATMPAPEAVAKVPSLTIPTSTIWQGDPRRWNPAVRELERDAKRRFYLYNGGRPATATMATEDDGIAMRQLAWCQFKSRADRWFIWQGTYYNNFQGNTGHTRLFSSALTFGKQEGRDRSLGETGQNYNNGDGVLFYPGTDHVYPNESYDIDGPIASLRLKHWRRGLQDYEYLQLASKVDPAATNAIVRRMIPRVLWEIGVSDPNDPTWVRAAPSWPVDPNRWEDARQELAGIITRYR